LYKGKIENRTYQLKLESYNRRVGIVDSSMAELEAQKAMKKIRMFKGFAKVGANEKRGEK